MALGKHKLHFYHYLTYNLGTSLCPSAFHLLGNAREESVYLAHDVSWFRCFQVQVEAEHDGEKLLVQQSFSSHDIQQAERKKEGPRDMINPSRAHPQ